MSWQNVLLVLVRHLVDVFLPTGEDCSFRRALQNNYFGKVLLINFVSTTSNNLLKHCISNEFLLMEDFVQGPLRKELHIASLVERFKTTTLGMFHG